MTPVQQAAARAASHDVHALETHLRLPLLRMMRDCPHGTITLTSGYRPPDYQGVLFAAAVRKYGSQRAARRWVAPPGGSNHGRRRAADLGWPSPAARRWAHLVARSYGLHFPMSWEHWHIEAVSYTGPVPADPNPPQQEKEKAMALSQDDRDDVRTIVRQEVAAQVRTIIGADDEHGGDADPSHISQRDTYRLLQAVSGKLDKLAVKP